MEEADFVLCRSTIDEKHILDMGISREKYQFIGAL